MADPSSVLTPFMRRMLRSCFCCVDVEAVELPLPTQGLLTSNQPPVSTPASVLSPLPRAVTRATRVMCSLLFSLSVLPPCFCADPARMCFDPALVCFDSPLLPQTTTKLRMRRQGPARRRRAHAAPRHPPVVPHPAAEARRTPRRLGAASARRRRLTARAALAGAALARLALLRAVAAAEGVAMMPATLPPREARWRPRAAFS